MLGLPFLFLVCDKVQTRRNAAAVTKESLFFFFLHTVFLDQKGDRVSR